MALCWWPWMEGSLKAFSFCLFSFSFLFALYLWQLDFWFMLVDVFWFPVGLSAKQGLTIVMPVLFSGFLCINEKWWSVSLWHQLYLIKTNSSELYYKCLVQLHEKHVIFGPTSKGRVFFCLVFEYAVINFPASEFGQHGKNFEILSHYSLVEVLH